MPRRRASSIVCCVPRRIDARSRRAGRASARCVGTRPSGRGDPSGRGRPRRPSPAHGHTPRPCDRRPAHRPRSQPAARHRTAPPPARAAREPHPHRSSRASRTPAPPRPCLRSCSVDAAWPAIAAAGPGRKPEPARGRQEARPVRGRPAGQRGPSRRGRRAAPSPLMQRNRARHAHIDPQRPDWLYGDRAVRVASTSAGPDVRWRSLALAKEASAHDRFMPSSFVHGSGDLEPGESAQIRRKEKRDRDVTGVPRRMELDSDGAATAFRQTGVGGSRPSLAFATLLESRHALLRARGAPLTAHSRARTARWRVAPVHNLGTSARPSGRSAARPRAWPATPRSGNGRRRGCNAATPTASDVAGFERRPATASQPRLAASGELSDYWSCFDCCSPSLDSGDSFGKPPSVSVSGSPGWSCVDSFMRLVYPAPMRTVRWGRVMGRRPRFCSEAAAVAVMDRLVKSRNGRSATARRAANRT